MNPVRKAIWYVESHFAADVMLDDIARSSGVSAYHLTRAFAAVTGLSAIRYVRGRRLTEAAHTLANGAPDILAVALDAGYGSHEAFTRAFRDQFGITPEAVRAQRHLDNIELVEPIKMTDIPLPNLEPPRLEVTTKPLLIAGLVQRYASESNAGIPAQWQRFHPFIGNIHGQVAGRVTYGVVCNGDDSGIDYVCGVEVRDFSELPEEFARLRIPAQTYAVFSHRDHVSSIRSTCVAIWNKWLPESGHKAVDAPFFERYSEAFDPRTGMGGAEIWIPIEKKVG
jgi:AraC family transcriptional regulator